MKKKQMIEDLVEGMGVDSLFLLDECDLRRARNGSLYFHLILADRTGRVNARRWDAREKEASEIAAGDILKVGGFVESYRGRPQIIVRSFSPVTETDEVAPEDFLPSSPRETGEMLRELKAILAEVERPALASLLDAFFGDPAFEKRFCRAPAGVKLHHAYLGGLLEHTLAVTKAAKAVAELYPTLDKDLLLVGAFLHDVGKTEELLWERRFAYADRGRLVGHIQLGAEMLSERARGVEGFPAGLLDVLTHIILSHHGRYEFGSPKLPMTSEAVVLQFLDDLDAKVMAVEALKKDGGKEGWSDYIRSFERAFYLGGDGA